MGRRGRVEESPGEGIGAITAAQPKRKRRKGREIMAEVQREMDAWKACDPSVVVVRCGTCSRPIATSAVDRAKGFPPVMMSFPENARGWTCSDCALRRMVS